MCHCSYLNWSGKADERAGKSEDLPWNTLHLNAIVDSGGVDIARMKYGIPESM